MTSIPDGKPTPAQLRREYECGASVEGLAVLYHMATRTVLLRLRSAETVMRPSVTELGADRTATNLQVLEALAKEPGRELSCADIAGLIGRGYPVVYRTLGHLANAGFVASREPDPDENGGRLPYRLTEAGLAHVLGAQPRSTTPVPEPLITGVTAQILLALLQHPIRSWRAVDLANRVRCQPNTVIRFAVAMGPAGWATTGHSATKHNGPRVDITLTDHGVTQAVIALQREYGGSPALVVLANAMHPPVQLIEV